MEQTKIVKSPLNPLGISEQELEGPAVGEAKALLQMLDPLLANPHFQEFWAKFGQAVTEQAKVALDPAAEEKDRTRAVHVHHVLKSWYEWPMRQRAAAIARITAMEGREKQRAKQGKPEPSL